MEDSTAKRNERWRCSHLEVGSWKLEVGGTKWKLEARKLEVGSWKYKVEIGSAIGIAKWNGTYRPRYTTECLQMLLSQMDHVTVVLSQMDRVTVVLSQME